MTARQINLALRIAAISLCGIALVSLIVGLLVPLETSEPAGGSSHSKSDSTTSAPGTLPPLETFAGIWTNPLRRPLGDAAANDAGPAPVVAPAATAGAAGSVPFTLVGTIGESLAMLKVADGSVVVGGVGDTLDGADILAVRPAQVDVRFQGRTVTLDKASDEVDDSQFISRDSNAATESPTSAMVVQHP